MLADRRALDVTLLRRLRSGDHVALEELYARYGGAAHQVAVRTLRAGGLAEDTVQEAFFELWRRPETYDASRASLGTWICLLTHRRAVDLARREARREAIEASGDCPTAESQTTEELVLLLTERRRVDVALRELRETDRRVLELAYHGGLTQTQIAERLELSLGTVKSRMFGALRRLRAVLEESPTAADASWA